jgi:hypothetical protein
MVGLAEFELVPEDFVQLIIVVLPGMNDDMVYKLVEETHYAGEADDLRAGADDGEDFEFLHF